MASNAARSRAVDTLPRIDEHEVSIAAGPDGVWTGLLETIDRTFGGRAASAYARLVGCSDHTRSGPRPLDAGSTVVGFRLVSADPGHQLVLEGRHRFSDYALTFRIDSPEPGRSVLRAESRATFPGPLGSLYHLLVVGTRGHAISVRRLLSGVRRRAEQPARSRG